MMIRFLLYHDWQSTAVFHRVKVFDGEVRNKVLQLSDCSENNFKEQIPDDQTRMAGISA